MLLLIFAALGFISATGVLVLLLFSKKERRTDTDPMIRVPEALVTPPTSAVPAPPATLVAAPTPTPVALATATPPAKPLLKMGPGLRKAFNPEKIGEETAKQSVPLIHGDRRDPKFDDLREDAMMQPSVQERPKVKKKPLILKEPTLLEQVQELDRPLVEGKKVTKPKSSSASKGTAKPAAVAPKNTNKAAKPARRKS